MALCFPFLVVMVAWPFIAKRIPKRRAIGRGFAACKGLAPSGPGTIGLKSGGWFAVTSPHPVSLQ